MDPFNLSEGLAANEQHEYRIYADNNAFVYCVVDREDYEYLIRWRWHVNKPHPTRNGTKQYMCRQTSNGNRPGIKLYLHIEVMKRTGIVRPSPLHWYCDHRDGNEFNCRRSNLRWTTPKENNVTSQLKGKGRGQPTLDAS